MKLTGYHGTTIINANSIIKNGFNDSGHNAWFGKGVYFFESVPAICDGTKEASDWCLKVKKFRNYAIIKSSIVKNSNSIDLVSNETHLDQFNRLRNILYKKHIETKKSGSDFTDRLVFAFMVKIRTERTKCVDYIRASVDARPINDYTTYVVGRLQVQICVRNCNIINDSIIIKSETST